MSKHWIKEDLKQDVVLDNAEKVIAFIKAHRDYVIGSLVSLIIVAVVGYAVAARMQSVRQTAWEKLFQAEQLAYADKVDDSFKVIAEIDKDFSGSDVWPYAQLLKGDTLFQQKKYADAAAAYENLIKRGKPALLQPFAYAGDVESLESAGNYSEAIAKAQTFLSKQPEHFLAPQIYLSMARSQELSGNAAGARESYEKVGLHYPNTYWAAMAAAKLTTKK